jgi:hypothetical protein
MAWRTVPGAARQSNRITGLRLAPVACRGIVMGRRPPSRPLGSSSRSATPPPGQAGTALSRFPALPMARLRRWRQLSSDMVALWIGRGRQRIVPSSTPGSHFTAPALHVKTSTEVPPLLTPNLARKLRRAIGLIAVYAFALQTILGGVAPRLAAAFDPAVPFDLAAICLSSHGGAGPAGDIPEGSGNRSQAGDHCAICTLSAPLLLVPPEDIRVTIDVTVLEPAAPAQSAPPLSKQASRPGGARAPPTIA